MFVICAIDIWVETLLEDRNQTDRVFMTVIKMRIALLVNLFYLEELSDATLKLMVRTIGRLIVASSCLAQKD